MDDPTFVLGLVLLNWVRPVTLAAGRLYVLAPIQLLLWLGRGATRQHSRRSFPPLQRLESPGAPQLPVHSSDAAGGACTCAACSAVRVCVNGAPLTIRRSSSALFFLARPTRGSTCGGGGTDGERKTLPGLRRDLLTLRRLVYSLLRRFRRFVCSAFALARPGRAVEGYARLRRKGGTMSFQEPSLSGVLHLLIVFCPRWLRGR